jgi:hypothetical protein
MVAAGGLLMAAAGMAFGLVGALFLTRVLRTLLYGIKLTDITAFFVVCAILGAAAVSACYLPVRRAASVDPDGRAATGVAFGQLGRLRKGSRVSGFLSAGCLNQKYRPRLPAWPPRVGCFVNRIALPGDPLLPQGLE